MANAVEIERNKALVRKIVEEMFNRGNLNVRSQRQSGDLHCGSGRHRVPEISLVDGIDLRKLRYVHEIDLH